MCSQFNLYNKRIPSSIVPSIITESFNQHTVIYTSYLQCASEKQNLCISSIQQKVTGIRGKDSRSIYCIIDSFFVRLLLEFMIQSNSLHSCTFKIVLIAQVAVWRVTYSVTSRSKFWSLGFQKNKRKSRIVVCSGWIKMILYNRKAKRLFWDIQRRNSWKFYKFEPHVKKFARMFVPMFISQIT